MAGQTNAYAKAHLVLEKEVPEGRAKLQKPTCRQELYAYFGVVIYIKIMIKPAVKNYWGPIKKGTAYKVTEYILKNQFEQLKRYIRCSPVLENSFHIIFNRVDKLSKHLQVLCHKFQRPSPHLAINKTIQRFVNRVPEIVNIPSKPTPKGFKIQVLANQGYVLDQLWYTKSNKKGLVDLNRAIFNKGFIKT